MSIRPPFIAPTRHTDADSALAQVQALYQTSLDHLRQAMREFVTGNQFEQRVRAFYPFVRIHTKHGALQAGSDAAHLSYGFVAEPGRYETTLTRPDLFAAYYREQFRLLLQNHGGSLEVGVSHQPIPVHFSFADHDHVEGEMNAERRQLMREVFDLPDLTAMDDGIANGTFVSKPNEPQPLSLFTAARMDYSLQRLRHYSGTSPEHFQNYVLFTNYQFYIDEFVRLGHEAMQDPNSEYIAFVEPGNVVTRRAGLSAEVNDALGKVPLGAPRPHGHHHGEHWRGPRQREKHHRPHCRAAPACVAHARPLRGPTQHTAARRLRAGPWLCARRPCAGRGATAVGAHPSTR
jgi:AMP nucleosidase